MIEKPFLKQFEEAFDKEGRERKAKDRKWMLAHPGWTVAIVFVLCAVVVMCVFGALGAWLNPAPPITPDPVMTMGGFADWVFRLQLPAALWGVIFVLLWLTKWS